MEGLLCEADQTARKITFYVRDGFGDGTDGGGFLIGPDQEREKALKIFNEAIDVVVGERRPKFPIERWVSLRYLAPEREVGSRD